MGFTDGFKYTVYSKEDNVSSTIARRLQVTVQMPWYLNQVNPGSSVRLVLNDEGLPVYQGLEPVNFTLLVPRSLVDNGTAGGVLQYVRSGPCRIDETPLTTCRCGTLHPGPRTIWEPLGSERRLPGRGGKQERLDSGCV